MSDEDLDAVDPPVTVAVSRRVKPGQEKAFESFVLELSKVAMAFEGHLGANIFRPTQQGDNEYRIIFKFNRRSNYQKWFDSKEREALMLRACDFLMEPPVMEVIDGLETWFTLPDTVAAGHPPRYKMALLTWMVLFPLVTIIFGVFEDFLVTVPLVPRTLVVTLVVVVLMTWIVMPRVTRLFQHWLYKDI